MALVGNPRFTPGRGSRYDALANVNEDPFCWDNNDGPDSRHIGHDVGESDSTD